MWRLCGSTKKKSAKHGGRNSFLVILDSISGKKSTFITWMAVCEAMISKVRELAEENLQGLGGGWVRLECGHFWNGKLSFQAVQSHHGQFITVIAITQNAGYTGEYFCWTGWCIFPKNITKGHKQGFLFMQLKELQHLGPYGIKRALLNVPPSKSLPSPLKGNKQQSKCLKKVWGLDVPTWPLLANANNRMSD